MLVPSDMYTTDSGDIDGLGLAAAQDKPKATSMEVLLVYVNILIVKINALTNIHRMLSSIGARSLASNCHQQPLP